MSDVIPKGPFQTENYKGKFISVIDANGEDFISIPLRRESDDPYIKKENDMAIAKIEYVCKCLNFCEGEDLK